MQSANSQQTLLTLRPNTRGGFKAESLLGHITRKASPPSLLPPLPFSLLSLRSRPSQIQLGGLGSAVSSPGGSVAEPKPKLNLVHFSLKI